MEEVIEGDLPAGSIANRRVMFGDLQRNRYYFVKWSQGGNTKDQYVFITGHNDGGAGMVVYSVLAERAAGGAWADLESDYKEDVTRAQVNNVAGGISAHFYVPGTPTTSPSTVNANISVPSSGTRSRSGSSMNDPRIQRALIATAPNDRYRILFHSNNPRFTIRVRRRQRRRPVTRRGRHGRRGIAIMERTRTRRRRRHLS